MEQAAERVHSSAPSGHVDPAGAATHTRLPEVTAPTLVINGLSDVPGIQEVSALPASGIPGARRLDLPEAGHLPPVERPVEVTEALTTFLRAVFQGAVSGFHPSSVVY
ncbi:alpha/beta fold hydrolase [Nonomuraea sp. PA05]|uniref:alpha/beta fold hydrolase n=1 Tax=Nonomuraea sp. PA05 TaxID=2604466 RepID=UPI001CA30D2B|nr:alpha/beta hydrolase [Nonomuraea sp. PA05]